MDLQKHRPPLNIIMPMKLEEVAGLGYLQLKWIFVSLVPHLEYYFGSLSMQHAMRFATFYEGGLGWLNSAGLALYSIDKAVLLTHTEDVDDLKGGDRKPIQWSTGFSLPDRPIVFHIKIIDAEGQSDDEIDLMIQYADLLLEKCNQSLLAQESDDKRATLVPTAWDPDFTLYKMSMVDQYGSHHTYDIRHEGGCKSLLSRDGKSLLENNEVVVWSGQKKIGRSSVGFHHPAALSQTPTTVEVPREFVSLAISKAVTEATKPAIEQLLASYPLYFTVKITSGKKKQPAQRPPASEQSLEPATSKALVKVPDIDLRVMEWMWKHGISWQMLSDKQLLIMQGAISAMQGNGQGSSGGPSGSNSPPAKDNQVSRAKPEKPSQDNDKSGADGNGDPDPINVEFSVETALGNGWSLIEAVATRKTTQLAHLSTSSFAKQLDASFIKKLSGAGLAQVVIKHGAHPADGVMAISKTLVKFLLAQSNGLPEKSEGLEDLEKQVASNSYYIELDLQIYDLLLEHFEKVAELTRLRSEVFQHFIENLEAYIESRNAAFGTSQFRYVYIGGEAVRLPIGNNPSSWLRDNLPITDDFDVLMSAGTQDDFLQTLNNFVSGRTLYQPSSSTVAFNFPCGTSCCKFKLMKLGVMGVWGEFLPTLDISFPAIEDLTQPMPLAPLADQLSTMSASLDWSLKYCHWKREKTVDRIMLLNELMPDYYGVKYAYLKGILYPELLAEKQKLEASVTDSTDKYSRLSAEVKRVYEELETLKGKKAKEHADLERELEERFKAEHEAALQAVENDRQELEVRLQASIDQQKELQQQIDAEVAKNAKTMGKLDSLIEAERLAKQEAKNARKDRDAAQSRAKALTGENTRLGRETADAKAKAEQAAERNLELKERNEKSLSRLNKARAATKESTQTIADLKESKRKLEEQVQLYTIQLSTNEKARSKLTEEINSKNDRLASASRTLDKALQEMRQMRKKLQKLEKHNTELVEVHELQNQVHVAELIHQQERTEAFRIDRNWAFGAGFFAAGVLAYREYIHPYLHKHSVRECSSFSHAVVQEYCSRNQLKDGVTLEMLEIVDEMARHTKIPKFNGKTMNAPGYSTPSQQNRENLALVNDLQQDKFMHLLVPVELIPVNSLGFWELNQLLMATKSVLVEDDSITFSDELVSASLLLCGVMNDYDNQEKCVQVLSAELKTRKSWPCHMHFIGETKTNICEKMIVGTLTSSFTKKFRLGMLPVWKVQGDGGLSWYDTWPVAINQFRFKQIVPGQDCPVNIEVKALCDGSALRMWSFFDNHWHMKTENCTDLHVVQERGLAFWVQSWDGRKNQYISCDKSGLLQTAW